MNRGQSLVELAVCAPVVMLLTVGAVASAQVIDARAGLEAATQAAAAEAARAPDPSTAETAARTRFEAMVAGYPLSSPRLSVAIGGFTRSDEVVASGSGAVDISWASLVFPKLLRLDFRVTAALEPWRSHRSSQ